MSTRGTQARFVLIRPRRGESDEAARQRTLAEHPDASENDLKFAREIFDQPRRDRRGPGRSTRGGSSTGEGASHGGVSISSSVSQGPPPPPSSPWFLGPVVFSSAPERGSENFRVSGASLEMALSECFPTPSLGQRTQWLPAPTAEYSVDEVADETYKCLQAQGKRVEDSLGPYQFRLYCALLVKAVKAASSRCAGDEAHYNLSQLQGFLDEVGVCHVPAPVAEMLSRHFPRRDGGQKYFAGLEDYSVDDGSSDSTFAVNLGKLHEMADAEQRGAAVTALDTQVGCSAVDVNRGRRQDPMVYVSDAQSDIGRRIRWSRSLKKKVEDFFYRLKATSRGDGPRIQEINFSRWAREDMVVVRSPLCITTGSSSELAEIKARHSCSREEVAVDWAMQVRLVKDRVRRGSGQETKLVYPGLSLTTHYPEFLGVREAPFFTVASGRTSLLRTLVRALV